MTNVLTLFCFHQVTKCFQQFFSYSWEFKRRGGCFRGTVRCIRSTTAHEQHMIINMHCVQKKPIQRGLLWLHKKALYYCCSRYALTATPAHPFSRFSFLRFLRVTSHLAKDRYSNTPWLSVVAAHANLGVINVEVLSFYVVYFLYPFSFSGHVRPAKNTSMYTPQQQLWHHRTRHLGQCCSSPQASY